MADYLADLSTDMPTSYADYMDMPTDYPWNDTNFTGYEQGYHDVGAIRKEPITILSVTIAVSLVGNSLMIATLLESMRRRHSLTVPIQQLLVHSCVSDIAFALVAILPQLIETVLIPNFYGDTVWCKTIRFFQVAPMYASSYFEVSISIDRYIAICQPFTSLWLRHRVLNFLIAMPWVIATIFSLPQLVFFKINTYTINGTVIVTTCGTLYSRDPAYQQLFDRLYVSWFCISAWLLPSLLILGFYAPVIRLLLRRNLRSNHALVQVRQTQPGIAPPSSLRQKSSLSQQAAYRTLSPLTAGRYSKRKSHPLSTSSQKQVNTRKDTASSTTSFSAIGVSSAAPGTSQKRSSLQMRWRALGNQGSKTELVTRRKIQTVKLTLTIVVCNFALWSPFCITSLVDTFFPNLIDHTAATFVLLSGNLNSCVNPWIYFLFHSRQALDLFRPKRPAVRQRRRPAAKCPSAKDLDLRLLDNGDNSCLASSIKMAKNHRYSVPQNLEM